jgi:hypothetical protein
MKKLMLILLACLVSVFIIPLGNAQTPDEETPALETVCDGLEGQAFELCEAYCEAQDCDEYPDGRSCVALKRNYARVTGIDYLPCDIIACALCGDPDPNNPTNTIGECVEIQAVDCVEFALAVGEYSCDDVTIPSNLTPGCIIPPQFGYIPNCQNGIPAWVCTLFIQGTVVDQCPHPPSCFDE